MTMVFGLGTGQRAWYSCSPREAVMAAYAQSRGDWNTFRYEERYGGLVRYTPSGLYVTVGDFTAMVNTRGDGA